MKAKYIVPSIHVLYNEIEPCMDNLSQGKGTDSEDNGAKSSTTNFSIWDDEDDEEE